MDENIKKMIKRCKRYAWLIPLMAVIGALCAFQYVRSNSYIEYSAQATLLSLNIDKQQIWGLDVTLEDVTSSRRMVQNFLGVAYSLRLSKMASSMLGEQGINLSPQQISSMIDTSAETTSNIITISARSRNQSLVIPVVNTVAESFIAVIYDLFGTNYLTVLDEAESIRVRQNLDMTTNVVYGFSGGLICGCALVYLLAVLRKRIRYIEDVMHLPETENLLVVPLHSIK